MKSISRAFLGFLGWIAADATGQEVFLPAEGRLAQSDAVLFDPAATENDAASPPPAADLPVVDVSVPPAEIPRVVEARLVERKWKVIRFGGLGVTSTDNLFISATDTRSDVSFRLSAGLAVGWGDYSDEVRQLGGFERYFVPLNLEVENTRQTFVFAKYSATASFFMENGDEDAVDHDVLLAGRWESGKLTLGTRLRFQTLSDPDIDVGDRAQRTVYGGEITSSYAVSEKTSVELNVFNRSYDFDEQLDWSEWILEDWFNYQILPKTKVALGTRLGLADVQEAATQTFEQLVARVIYYPGAKLGLSLDGGVEWRQFGDDGGDDVFSVFNFTASYQPFDGTELSLSAFRRNSSSVSIADEIITATGISARAQQRFFQRYYLTLEGGYQDSDYRSTRTGDAAGRDDQTTYLRPGVAFDITKFFTAEAAYQYRRNDSSRADLGFTENVVTLQLNLQF